MSLSAGIRAADDRWSLMAYGKNLGNKDYALTISRSSLTPGSLQLLGPQRSFGIVAGLRI